MKGCPPGIEFEPPGRRRQPDPRPTEMKNNMNTIANIETQCRELSALREQLRHKFEARQKAVRLATAVHDDGIRALQDQCTARRDELIASLRAARDQFKQRKTLEFAGITVGFEKERDRLLLPPDDLLVDRIEKMLPATQADTILDRTVKVIKSAFKKLPPELLQKLGCSRVAGADQPVVRAADDDIELLVRKSLGSPAGAAAEPV